MGWIREIIFLPFSIYIIVLKFVIRKVIGCLIIQAFISVISSPFNQKSVTKNEEIEEIIEETSERRTFSGTESRSRHGSGSDISQPRNSSEYDIRSRQSSGNEARSRHSSGNEIRSRNNSGNEIRSRNNSGTSPRPGLLQRSDSIIQFPSSPPSQISRKLSSSSSGCSQRSIKIHVNQHLREEKLKSLRKKMQKIAAERNENSSVHAEKQENSASDRQQNEVDKTCTFSDIENNNNNKEDKTLIPVEQQQLEPDQPVTPTTRKRICKLARKRRAHTMPDIMMAPRARTISEQSEEYDKIMPLPVIQKYPRWKSCNSLNVSSSSKSQTAAQYVTHRFHNTTNNNTNHQHALLSLFNSSSSPPTTNSPLDSLKDALQSEIAAWQDAVTQKQFGAALLTLKQNRSHHGKQSRNVSEAHHRRLLNGHTVIKTNHQLSGVTSCKITVNSQMWKGSNGVKVSLQNGHQNGQLWQGLQKLENIPKIPSKNVL